MDLQIVLSLYVVVEIEESQLTQPIEQVDGVIIGLVTLHGRLLKMHLEVHDVITLNSTLFMSQETTWITVRDVLQLNFN